nr:immunoglobulin heavy chain junction region [Macaca mulatta]
CVRYDMDSRNNVYYFDSW